MVHLCHIGLLGTPPAPVTPRRNETPRGKSFIPLFYSVVFIVLGTELGFNIYMIRPQNQSILSEKNKLHSCDTSFTKI